MIRRVLSVLGCLGLACLLVYLSYSAGLEMGKTKVVREIQTDTVVVDHYDTTIVTRPIYITRCIVDTMVVHLNDTVQVVLDREQKVYADSNYRAWVSGYRPALDSIEVFSHSQIISVDRVQMVKTKPRWSVGLQAGTGVAVGNGVVALSPYVGVGVSYNLFSW